MHSEMKNDIKQVKACIFTILGILLLASEIPVLFYGGLMLWVWAICIFAQQAVREFKHGLYLIQGEVNPKYKDVVVNEAVQKAEKCAGKESCGGSGCSPICPGKEKS